MSYPKPVDKLTTEDIQAHAVWEFCLEEAEGQDETWVCPVQERPIATLVNRFVAVPLRLANGDTVWGTLGSIDEWHARRTRVFIDLAVYVHGDRFHMARYYDFNRGSHGPEGLAAFLGLAMDDVFPIAYDLTALVLGDAEALQGSIPREPLERPEFEERLRI